MGSSNRTPALVTEVLAMDLLLITSLIVSTLAGLGLAATRMGVDSRDPIADDRRR